MLLLQSNSKNCRFFGALTYTVVINNLDKSKDSETRNNEIRTLALIMVQHILSIVNLGNLHDSMIIVRKLISNLALLFIRSPLNEGSFNAPLHLLLHSLVGNPNVFTSGTSTEELYQIISSMDHDRISLLLLSSTVMVEEICKTECPIEIHGFVFQDSFTITSLIFQYLLSQPQISHQIDINSLECLMSWVSYIALAEDKSQVRYRENTIVIQFLFHHFELVTDTPEGISIINKAISVAIEILEINPHMLNHQLRMFLSLVIFSPEKLGERYLQILMVDSDENCDEINTLVNLMVALLRTDILHFAKTLTTPDTQHIFNVLTSMSNFPGIAIEDETVLDQILSFWEDLANVYIDDEDVFNALYENNIDLKQEFENKRNELFEKVCSIYWAKIHLPDIQILNSNKSEFFYYRSNVSDLFIVAYSLLKEPFYYNLTSSIVNDLQAIKLNGSSENKVIDLESTLYLLYKITDDCAYLESQSTALLTYINPLFEAGLIQVIQNCPHSGLFSTVYATVINFLSSIQFYFKSNHGSQHLGNVFDLLFGILLQGDQSLSLHASRTILKICQECRENLTSFLPNLEVLLVQMLRSPSTDNLIRQRLFNAYTSIAHCVRDGPKFGEILRKMLLAIHDRSLEVLDGTGGSAQEFSNEEERSDYLLSLLTCVHEVGKACQVPDEIDDFYSTEQKDSVDSFWKEDPLQIKQLILTIVNKFLLSENLMSGDLLVTEKCCLILKTGLGEAIHGPFVFPLETILKYMVLKMDKSDATSVSYIYSLLESLIIVKFKELNQEVIAEVINNIFTLKLDFIKTDPDMVQSTISLFATVLEKKPSLVIHLPVFESVILNFALEGIKAKEQFVIKASLKFWLTLLTLKKGTAEDQERIRNLMANTQLGPIFVFNLLGAFLDAPRSNLDYFYQVFRNLIAKYQQFCKLWLQIAYEEFVSSGRKLEESLYRVFSSKLLLTRGMREANDVLKKFWLQANGLIEFNTKLY